MPANICAAHIYINFGCDSISVTNIELLITPDGTLTSRGKQIVLDLKTQGREDGVFHGAAKSTKRV